MPSEKLWDFECDRCGVFEAWGNPGQKYRCPGCGGQCEPMIGSKGILLSFTDQGVPRAWRMWGDWHESEARKPAKE